MEYSLSEIRREYAQRSLSEHEVKENPVNQFKQWLDEAIKAQVPDSSAMVLSTANKENRVSSRVVLLKEIQGEGFVFYTNYNSKKAFDLKQNAQASILFYWPELERQIRIEGKAEKIPAYLSDKYFDSRPENSKIGAWASEQSREIPDRKYLEQQKLNIEEKFRHKKIFRPEFWGGYLVKPHRFEFWQGRESRLHDRIEYLPLNKSWKIKRLAP